MKRLIEGCKFFTASCITGCGQMYLGYMKRGLSLMLVFCALLALAIFLEMGALAVMLVPVWLYAFFDAYNLRRRLEGSMMGDSAEPDAYIFGVPEIDSGRFSELLGKRHSFIGWALVILGFYMLYEELVSRIFRHFWSELYYFMRWDVPRILLTVLIILLGVWFIRGPKKQPASQEPPFIPPAPPAKPAEPVRAAESPLEEGLPQEPAWPQPPAGPDAAEEEGHGDV